MRPTIARAADWHVNANTGNDASPGSEESPFKTAQKAVNSAGEGDTIHLHPKNAVYRQSVSFRSRSNLRLEGNGVTLDGADPIADEGWETVSRVLFRKRFPRTRWDRHLLIVDGVMERMGRTQSSNSESFPALSDLKPGQFRFENIDEQFGWLYVCGSTKQLEWATRPNGVATSGKCRNLIVRNLNARNFLNDGFNIHGDSRELKFENIVGYDCFDEGFSAHDTCKCEITNGRFYGNENGIADVNSAETSYRRCHFYKNVNTDVLLIGKSHRLLDCMIINSTPGAALVAGPRGDARTFELELRKCKVSIRNKMTLARVRVNGGTLVLKDCLFENTSFVPLGAQVTAEGVTVNGSPYRPEGKADR